MKKKLTSGWIAAGVKQPLSETTQFLAGHCLMSGANIQAWICHFILIQT